MFVTTSIFDALVLAALTEHVVAGNYSGPLYAAMLGLFSTNTQPTKASTIAGLVEVAGVTGYAQQALAPWGLPINESDGSVTMVSAACEFRATAAPVTAVDAWGSFIANAAGPPPDLLAAELFGAKFTFAGIGDGRVMLVSWNEHPNNGNTFTTVIS